jgi:hypothetical protein
MKKVPAVIDARPERHAADDAGIGERRRSRSGGRDISGRVGVDC